MSGRDNTTGGKPEQPTEGTSAAARELPEATRGLIEATPRVINVGLQSFSDAIMATGGSVVQYNWSPLAGGDRRLQKILSVLA